MSDLFPELTSVLELKWKKLDESAVIPSYKTSGAACFDISYCGPNIEIKYGSVFKLCTGLAVEIPQGYEMQVRSRSGFSTENGIMIVNGIGTIDSDYRGELIVPVVKIFPGFSVMITSGTRIAQGCLQKVCRVEHVQVSDLSDTARGTGGFGSTGK